MQNTSNYFNSSNTIQNQEDLAWKRKRRLEDFLAEERERLQNFLFEESPTSDEYERGNKDGEVKREQEGGGREAHVAFEVEFGSDVEGKKPIVFDVGVNKEKLKAALQRSREQFGDNVTLLYESILLPSSMKDICESHGKEKGGPWECYNLQSFYGWEAEKVVAITTGEGYLAGYILEAATRAKTELILILVDSENEWSKMFYQEIRENIKTAVDKGLIVTEVIESENHIESKNGEDLLGDNKDEDEDEDKDGVEKTMTRDEVKGGVYHIVKAFIEEKTGEDPEENRRFSFIDFCSWCRTNYAENFESVIAVLFLANDIFAGEGEEMWIKDVAAAEHALMLNMLYTIRKHDSSS